MINLVMLLLSLLSFEEIHSLLRVTVTNDDVLLGTNLDDCNHSRRQHGI